MIAFSLDFGKQCVKIKLPTMTEIEDRFTP